MQQTEEKNTKPPIAPTEPVSEPLREKIHLANSDSEPLPPEEADEIFFRAVAEIPTQPLTPRFTPQWEINRKLEQECAFTLFLFLFSLIAIAVLNVINQPIVTVTLLPVHKSVQLTTAIPVQTRTLAPVTLTRTLAAPTTGHGHQDARQATGTLTFYNGQATAQIVPVGTVFTGNDGVKIATEQALTIPAANAPSWGVASVTASAISAGSRGNIPLLDINTTVTSALFVKNLAAFTGGQDARDYKAVAKYDLDTSTAQLQEQLTSAMPQAFTLRPGEAVQTTHCTTHINPDHGIGEEAQMVTVNASKTCGGVAYSQDELNRKATIVFNTTRPGRQFERVGSVQTTVVRITPFIVRLAGLWEYSFSQDDEQELAQQIQGDTPAEARAYLFKTGFVSRVTMTQIETLPDFYHIKFLILIGV